MSIGVLHVLNIPIHTGGVAQTHLQSYDTHNTRIVFHSSVYILCSIITHHPWAQRQRFSTATAPPIAETVICIKNGAVHGKRKMFLQKSE